jgi:hypothetical protein
LNPVRHDRLSGSDELLDELDHIAAGDPGIGSIAPCRQNVQPQIAIIDGMAAFLPTSVLGKIARGQGPKGLCGCLGSKLTLPFGRVDARGNVAS